MIKVHGNNFFKHVGYLFPFIVFSQYGLVILYKAFFVRTWGTTKTRHGFMTETPLNETIISEQPRKEVESEKIIKGRTQSFVTSSIEDVNHQQQALPKDRHGNSK
jgi:hypothetical protein